ncbi:lasso RiPP family leader peptide-containing protein [Mycobacterium sp. UM_Kg27]|uniref:lasso RiPP family leader peptide-containing protein n=1 Tax=Mycobacterium sp. UM_Kg27 TaxID=1545693 RepID=UPI000AE7291C|nr:lasso RiPP family leader peptide-containing protein [Mycobacterium sp. UM_Kg27]
MRNYSPPQVVHVGDVRATTQGSGNYLSDSSTGYGYMGWYQRHVDTPDTAAPLPPRG